MILIRTIILLVRVKPWLDRGRFRRSTAAKIGAARMALRRTGVISPATAAVKIGCEAEYVEADVSGSRIASADPLASIGISDCLL
jgi:hypothetical protein